MIYQITIDTDNNVTNYSIGGLIPNGITVDSIPEDVQANWRAYKYIDGEFVFNADYVPPVEPEPVPQPTVIELQAKINELQDSVDLLILDTL